MSIESEKDFIGVSRVGKVVGLALREMQKKVSAGMTTADLDQIGARIFKRYGAQSAIKSPQTSWCKMREIQIRPACWERRVLVLNPMTGRVMCHRRFCLAGMIYEN